MSEPKRKVKVVGKPKQPKVSPEVMAVVQAACSLNDRQARELYRYLWPDALRAFGIAK